MGLVLIKSYPWSLRSSISYIIEMTSCSADDRAMYSYIAVDVATRVCNLEYQMMGQPEYVIIQPDQDLSADGSVSENERDQFSQ